MTIWVREEGSDQGEAMKVEERGQSMNPNSKAGAATQAEVGPWGHKGRYGWTEQLGLNCEGLQKTD